MKVKSRSVERLFFEEPCELEGEERVRLDEGGEKGKKNPKVCERYLYLELLSLSPVVNSCQQFRSGQVDAGTAEC